MSVGLGKTETFVYKYNLKKFFLIYKTQTSYLFKQLLSLLSADSCNDHFTLKFCTFAFLDMHVSGSSGYLSFQLGIFTCNCVLRDHTCWSICEFPSFSKLQEHSIVYITHFVYDLTLGLYLLDT